MSKTNLTYFDKFVQSFPKIFSKVFRIFLKFSFRFSEIFSKTIPCLYFYELCKFIKIDSTLTWISSIYQTFLKLSEKQVQNFNKFFVKFTQILSIINSSFFKILSIIYSSLSIFFFNLQHFCEVFLIIPLIVFQNFNKYYSKLFISKNALNKNRSALPHLPSAGLAVDCAH